ncbi:chaperone protein dnaJ C76, chloroplastic [Physcomitrium patens]|uniref:J domain-containing protein n=2 Tax=Physcomitrium patens TaxID=3218 RepID=A0A2K1IW49_PHYPA|nr:hypothetical protein PHYPA_025444 [Physcomitrium patens]
MAAYQATLPVAPTSRVPAQVYKDHKSSKRYCKPDACPSWLRPRDLLSMRGAPACTKSPMGRVETRAKFGGDGDVDLNGDVIGEDFYSVLGLTPDATQEEIKKAYYSCMKACHPDLSGNNSDSTDFCMFVNEIYEVLSDPEQRMVYDEINGYALTSANPFLFPKQERDHAFVDEFTCIGCKNCANVASDTFEIEEEYGRARVHCQVGDVRAAQEAIDTCPVDCIHWVTAAQLTLLEDEMRRVERVNVGMMLSGMGYQSPDVFAQASWRWEKRQAKAMEQARIRMMKEKGKDAFGAWWQGWSNPGGDEDFRPDDMGARKRAAKTAAASRRWREYSRQNAGRRSVFSLPRQSGTEDETDSKKETAVK